MRDAMRTVFERGAAFRRRSAARYPENAAQNLAAADFLDRLAGTVDDCAIALLKDAYRTDYEGLVHQTGIKFFPRDAAHFCREAIAREA